MKRFFEILGIVFLICFSFLYTEKSIMVVREQDPLMQQIIDNQDKYNIKPLDAQIINKIEVIPGYNGLSVDIYRSYTNMKKIGRYDDKLLIYKEQSSDNSIIKIFDKYIVSGNDKKNSVAIIFRIDNDTSSNDLKTIMNILNKNNIKATFFVDGKWVEDNVDNLIRIIRNNYEIGSLGYNNNYIKDSFVWNNNFIESITNTKIKYCYIDEIDNSVLDLCASYKMHTIKPNIIINSFPFNTVKNNLKKGSIISFNTNKEVINELSTIINFIKSKGYNINTLKEHLSEKR